MWTRKELKDSAKSALKRNYWKAVLLTAMFTVLVAGANAGTGIGGAGVVADSDLSAAWNNVEHFVQESTSGVWVVVGLGAVLLAVVSFAVSILLVNPLKVGFAAFGVNALRDKGKVSDMGYGFDVSYKRNVKTLFVMSLFTILWSMLLVVPGIIKAYEYSMIPYLLAEHPNMTREEAFVVSKEMMKGNKWKAFVLDLSFILWYILGALTLGITTFFYVEPYRCLTEAALYNKLKTLSDETR